MNVRQILAKSVQDYLAYNPEPKTFGDKVAGLFNASGAAGRNEAKKFLKDIINNVAYDADGLVKQVYLATRRDDDARLSDFPTLSTYLLEGMREVLGITDEDLDRKFNVTQTSYQKRWLACTTRCLKRTPLS